MQLAGRAVGQVRGTCKAAMQSKPEAEQVCAPCPAVPTCVVCIPGRRTHRTEACAQCQVPPVLWVSREPGCVCSNQPHLTLVLGSRNDCWPSESGCVDLHQLPLRPPSWQLALWPRGTKGPPAGVRRALHRPCPGHAFQGQNPEGC